MTENVIIPTALTTCLPSGAKIPDLHKSVGVATDVILYVNAVTNVDEVLNLKTKFNIYLLLLFYFDSIIIIIKK